VTETRSAARTDAGEPDTALRASGRIARALVAVGAPTALFAVHGWAYGWWVVDDAAITWAYARSLVAQAGPVLQPGVPAAEGWSNPSWLLVFMVVTWLGVPLVLAAKALAVAGAAATAGGMWWACRGAFAPWPATAAAGAAGCLAALVPSWVIWSVSGLETPLYGALVVWLAAACARARSGSWRLAVVAGALAAAAALTRPDGAVYAAAFPIATIATLGRRGIRPALVSLVVFAVPVGAYLVWRRSTFGLWVPNTAVAKAQGLPDPTVPLIQLGSYAGWFLATLIVLGLAAWWARPVVRDQLLGLGVTATLALIAYAVLEPDWMGELRFAAPLWPVASLAGVVATVALGRALGFVVLAVAVVATVATSWAPSAAAFRASPTVPACLVAQIDGHEINAYADIAGIRDGTFLVPDVGGAALVGRMRVVDLLGLTDRVVARYWATADMAGLRDHVYEQARPTFVFAHGDWARRTGILSDPRLARGYEQVSETTGGGLWVRRDVLAPGDLERMRAHRASVALPAELEVRAAPRARCSL
jgi:hypothetical protein